MKTITSVEFRKTYPRMTEAVQVESNGHAIGLWIPFDAGGFAPVEIRDGAIWSKPVDRAAIERVTAQTPQQKRDAILRRVNKGG